MDKDALLDYNARMIEEFRANGGRLGANFEGAPMVLLTTTGAKSGEPRTSPMMYLEFEERVFVFASNNGRDTHPQWYGNLVADPQVVVERGEATYPAVAVDITGDEHDRIYAEQAARYPGFGEYQAGTTRVIPVVELVPATGSD